MNCKFESLFAQRICAFIEQKHRLGFPYSVSEYHLSHFDRFCVERFPNEVALTKEIVLAWAVKRDTEQNNGFRNRLSPVREFAKYLNRIGEMAYVIPTHYVRRSARPTPYIYSETEIAVIWRILDETKPCPEYPTRHLVIPAIIRLLYCCGLRPGEACKLMTDDVNLKTGKIFIRESKGHKDRIVMLADDILALCRRYNEKMQIIMPGREAFFPNEKGQAYSKIWFSSVFRKYWNETGFPQFGANPPRVYDFRHTFATHRLHQWMLEGKNLSSCLPYLSAYLGHVLLSDTAYYIHLIPSFFKESPEVVGFHKCERLLPEVGE